MLLCPGLTFHDVSKVYSVFTFKGCYVQEECQTLWPFVRDPLNHQDEGSKFFRIIRTRNKRHSVTFQDAITPVLTGVLLWRWDLLPFCLLRPLWQLRSLLDIIERVNFALVCWQFETFVLKSLYYVIVCAETSNKLNVVPLLVVAVRETNMWFWGPTIRTQNSHCLIFFLCSAYNIH